MTPTLHHLNDNVSNLLRMRCKADCCCCCCSCSIPKIHNSRTAGISRNLSLRPLVRHHLLQTVPPLKPLTPLILVLSSVSSYNFGLICLNTTLHSTKLWWVVQSHHSPRFSILESVKLWLIESLRTFAKFQLGVILSLDVKQTIMLWSKLKTHLAEKFKHLLHRYDLVS